MIMIESEYHISSTRWIIFLLAAFLWWRVTVFILLVTSISSSFCRIQYRIVWVIWNINWMRHEDSFVQSINNLDFLIYSKSCFKRCVSFWLIMFVFLLHQIKIIAIISNSQNYISMQSSNYLPLFFLTKMC